MGRSLLSPLLTETSVPHAPADGVGEMTDQALAEKLRAQGVALTLQRLVIARVLLTRPIHLSADQVWARAKAVMPEISRATVYNTLDLFERSGLLRRLIIDAEKVVFDSNTASHHHLYDATTGEVIDIAPGELQVVGMPHLPPGLELEDVDVVVRVRRREA
ncbi:MAG: transcriptional repressor [Hyphomicrobiales bacterium]|nr:transcriptional repressor [Hyphomicrobiales bacterium]